MNRREREMVRILAQGREEYGYVAVKAEFEAEGTRMDELLRLVEISHRAGLKLAVKVGGCEAVRDLIESKQIGVDFIIAPMIESAYAVKKYALAKEKVYDPDEQQDTRFLFNMETIQCYDHREDVVAEAKGKLGGIVFGRSDFCGSLGMGSNDINEPSITERIVDVAGLCAANDLDLVVGGGVSVDSLDALRTIRAVHLSRFETRKVVFGADALDLDAVGDGMRAALTFEIQWLLNKREYYGAIHQEDQKRIETLESRWGVLQDVVE